MRLADLPTHTLPREKIAERGAANLREAELLAILLRTGYQGQNALQVATRLMKDRSLSELCSLPFVDLLKLKGVGKSRAATLLAVSEIAKIVYFTERVRISDPADAVQLLQFLKQRTQEYLIGIYLNARREVIAQQTITIGTLDANLIHPREVFAPALEQRAHSIILAHNHPSGDSTPSLEDIEATERLLEAGQLLDIPIVDHLVIAADGWTSFRREKLVEFRGSIA